MLSSSNAEDLSLNDAMADEKMARLRAILKSMGSVLVAFSGGVDSTFLLKVAHDELGDRSAGITATSPTYPEHELREATALATLIGARHIVVESNELKIPNFSDNTEMRCYHCKTGLFSVSLDCAKGLGFSHVADGFNADDTRDFRPGHIAAEELGVRSPLKEAGLTKDDIRALSRALKLPTWDKPAFACLSSRFPYGVKITEDRLKTVAKAEEFLRYLGLRQFRVRYHGDIGRIEVSEGDIRLLMEEGLRKRVVRSLKDLGFTYVALDLEGYRQGSLNEPLRAKREA